MAASKFTPETRTALLERFAAGVSIRDASVAVQVSEQTVKHWLARGRREEAGPYADFASEVEASRTEARQAAAKLMTPDEFDGHLARAVRGGSVQAMKLYWEISRERRGAESESDVFDELEL